MVDRSPARRRLDTPTAVGVVGALLFFAVAAVWSLASPLMGAPDEPAQTIKAVSVAHGQLRGEDVTTSIAGPPWVNGTLSYFDVPADYAAVYDLNACYVTQPEVPAGCAPSPSRADGTSTASTYVGTYPPLYYALVGWPSLVADAPLGLHLIRLASAAVSAALVGLALTAARRTDGGGVVVAGLLVAITPMVIYMASVVNASGMEITSAIALWCTSLALLRPADRTTRGDVVRAAIAFCALTSVRGLSPVLAVGVLAAVALTVARRSDLERVRRAPGFVPAAVVSAVVFVLALAYVVWSKAYDAVSGVPITDLTLTDALQASFEQVPYRTRQMVGYFAYLEAPPPVGLLVLWGILVGALVLGALVAGTWRRRMALVGLVLATIVFTVVPEALNASEFGYIWQGRYSLPVATGIPILAAWILGRASWWRPALALPATAAVATLWLVGQTLGLATMLRRYVVGTDRSLFAVLTGDGWAPPLSPVTLLVLMTLAGLAFVTWTMWTATQPGPGLAPPGPADDQEPTTSPISAENRPPNASSP
ncbi:MAG TPA: DUF2142 domain-containing protein [Acidimicrobiales bacterium]